MKGPARPLSAPATGALLALALMALVLPGSAFGKPSSRGQFGIAPSHRDVIATPPARLVPTRVYNDTLTNFDVTVFPVVLAQSLDGSYGFPTDPTSLRNAQLIVNASPNHFKLKSGQARMVDVRWVNLASSARAGYVGIVFQAIAPTPKGQPISSILRLLSTNFLTLPGPHGSTGKFTGMRAAQFGKQLRFYPRVKNTGPVADKPTNTIFVIHDAHRRTVFRVRWPGDVVLPGAEREFTIAVDKLLPAGQYRAAARMNFGRSRSRRIVIPFTLAGPNQLPSPFMSLENLNGRGYIGEPAHITGDGRSSGTAPASLDVRIELARGSDISTPIARTTLRLRNVAPGTQQGFDATLGQLTAGAYQATLTYTNPGAAPETRTVSFIAIAKPSFWSRLWRWFKDHLGLVIIGVSLLPLIILALLLRRLLRRHRRELEQARAEAAGVAAAAAAPTDPTPAAAPVPSAASPATPTAAPVAPAPAPPPPAEVSHPITGVDLNSASAPELMALPGVGQAAADAIVADRAAHGPFATVDDLARVKGFGEKRVAALRDHIRA